MIINKVKPPSKSDLLFEKRIDARSRVMMAHMKTCKVCVWDASNEEDIIAATVVCKDGKRLTGGYAWLLERTWNPKIRSPWPKGDPMKGKDA